MKEALATAQIWEHKYHAIDKSRLEYRENAVKLISQNESLHKSVNQVSGGSNNNSHTGFLMMDIWHFNLYLDKRLFFLVACPVTDHYQ